MIIYWSCYSTWIFPGFFLTKTIRWPFTMTLFKHIHLQKLKDDLPNENPDLFWRTNGWAIHQIWLRWTMPSMEFSNGLGLQQYMTSAWSALSIDLINHALRSWQDRIKMMTERDGHDVEHKLDSRRWSWISGTPSVNDKKLSEWNTTWCNL